MDKEDELYWALNMAGSQNKKEHQKAMRIIVDELNARADAIPIEYIQEEADRLRKMGIDKMNNGILIESHALQELIDRWKGEID